MKKYVIIIVAMFGILVPDIVMSQKNNRISVQTGLFHSFFDGSAIVNKVPNNAKRLPFNLFKGKLNASQGIQFQRMITNKSLVAAEYMFLNTEYNLERVYSSTAKPVVYARQLKYFNISYTRKLRLSNQFDFVYGVGLNYLWGHERIYHYTAWAGWGGEDRTYGYYRNDIGLNARTGIEYSPLKWLTFYTNFDFIGIACLGAKDMDGITSYDYYKEKHGTKNIPSRYDLSWRFGMGFNF